MAYVSAAYSKNWSYDKHGTNFDAKLGALLTNGADLQATCYKRAAATCSVQQMRRSSGTSSAASQKGNVNDNPYRTEDAAEPWIGPHPGFAWVDEHGSSLAIGPPASASAGNSSSGGRSSPASATKSSPDVDASSHATSPYAGMTASQRSMALWEKVSPGMMPDTTRTPPATTAEAFVYNTALLQPVDFTHHLKRTDFAEYTECKLRHMHHLKAAAKK